MAEIAFINQSKVLGDPDVAWVAAAVDAQQREDFIPSWPDLSYSPANFYTTKKDLPVASGLSVIFAFVDDWKNEGQAAFHSWVGVPFVQIGVGMGDPTILATHEACEFKRNEKCNKVFTLPDGSTAAYEVSDPVQGFTYVKKVTLMGETRDVEVSAFCLRPYFEDAPGPTYYCPGNIYELAPRSIAPGGYLPILGPNGWEPRFGFGTDRDLTAAKAGNPTGRAAMRRAAR